MANPVQETGTYVNLTASGVALAKGGNLLGIWVSSHTSGTIKVWDNATAASGPVIVNTFTPTAGAFHPLPFVVGSGVFVTLGGTIDCTVSVRAADA